MLGSVDKLPCSSVCWHVWCFDMVDLQNKGEFKNAQQGGSEMSAL